MMDNKPAANETKAFTKRYPSISDTLKSEVAVFAYSGSSSMPINMPVSAHPLDFYGLWDTGANCSVINQAVVDRLGLKPVRFGKVAHANGEYLTPFFYVGIGLPNHVIVNPLLVPLGNPYGCDVLIGMDVIGKGDFAVSSLNGKTTFSFRIPSVEEIDYVKMTTINSIIGKRHGKGKRKKK